MDSFELNKILGAVLGTLLFVMGVGFLAEAIYHPIEGRGPGYELPEPEGSEHGTVDQPEVVAMADIGTLLATADALEGAGQARKCQGCHTLDNGGSNSTGPNLWGVVGRVIGSHEGFAYSPDLLARKEAGETWTYDTLQHFLFAPKSFGADIKMNFSGLKDDRERANIIAFLSTLSDSPVPFPAPATAEAVPAEGEAAHAEPAADVVVPAETVAPPVETPDATATEAPVEGTSTTTNVPAGAEEQPAPAATEAAPAAETPAAPAQ